VELAQPLRIESGVASATLAAVPADYFDPVTFTTRRFDVTPSGRQITLSIFADQDLKRWGLLRVGAVAARQRGNIADQPLDLGVTAAWRVGF
jgi:hypothetical protein